MGWNLAVPAGSGMMDVFRRYTTNSKVIPMSHDMVRPVRVRRVTVREMNDKCLSCVHGRVRMRKDHLKVTCAKRHTSAVGCPDFEDDGRSELLHAIVRRLRRTQQGYRKVFNVVQPDCPNCKQNCCTRPFLKRTPFYGEDAIYYLLIGQPLPDIPPDTDHCIFFNQGCTLPAHLRPHVCIEYKCPFVESPPQIDVLGERMNQDAIYLLAVATQEYEGWRGVYDERDDDGKRTGLHVDRFKNRWNPSRPLDDLYVRYGLESAEG